MEGDELSSWCHHWSYRYVFLFFLSSIRLMSNYCLEMPSGLEDTIIKVMGVTTAEYDLLFSVSAWPSIVLCLIGGIIIDKLVGLRLGLLVFVTSVLVGQTIWGVGGLIDNYFIMLVGRFFIGAGNELTVVICHAYKALWFKEDLPLAFSIDIAFGRIGGAIALIFPQIIYDSLTTTFVSRTVKLSATLFITAAAYVLVGVSFSIIVVIMDYKRKVKSKKIQEKRSRSITLKGLKQFSISYWLILMYNFTSVPILYAFVSVAQDFYIEKYGLSIGAANIANSLQFGATVLFTPIVGIVVSKTGYFIYWLLIAIVPSVTAYLIFMFSYGQSFIPYITGILNSLVYTMTGPPYPALLAMIIDKEYITTAYGISRGLSFNASLAILMFVTGLIVDDYGYFILQAFYLVLTSFGSIALVLVLLIDMTVSEKLKLNFPGPWLTCKNDKTNNKLLPKQAAQQKDSKVH
ncbi:PREDICTED: major facilitator superfamily domain-containing protein 1-like [Amphimedon queenslandica]|uniref:Lysosomal dipeptide transporter MFSD1 n=1 Tax=Amphimedon queenslandica TaxID=400682 RepID=A0A1X7VV13_AMPQE|nr:PREDICTED: major facilitator superfamily domain-containing protein 1-like [Amphimedon queenslandica]|eukprot:XP_003382714.1 PREDICTED: major facilitator superfamily domain-containing protein 1-like [Amphimedon queenslandica]